MNILITGGAGFIGSNICESALRDPRINFVRVLDNLATGHLKNLEPFSKHPKFEFIEGDICNFDTCIAACKGMDRILHQAALGSVPRSIKDPILSNQVNIGGTLNIFQAARETNIDRIIFAASSSTYGDSKELPKQEDIIGKPMSPYAVTKLVNELYADVFHNLFNIDYIGLRYFNIFGPKQDPNGAYAAVIPKFIAAALKGVAPTINGDGTYSRDFTYVENAVNANILSLFTKNKKALNQIYNIAIGERTSLNELWQHIQEISETALPANYGPTRSGDVPHSLADISKAKELLSYAPDIKIGEGLKKTLHWYKSAFILQQ